MPYTLAHAAAVVPLWRRARGLSLSGLVAGSVAPDLLYYRGDHPGALDAHTPVGIFVWALPLGLALLAFFHAALKRPALLLPPEAHQRVLAPHAASFTLAGARTAPLRKLSLIILSVLLGAITHVLWDAFTHDDSAVGPLAWLAVPVFRLGLTSVSIARVLQVVCSVVGLALLARWYFRFWRAATLELDAAASQGGVGAAGAETDTSAPAGNPFVTPSTRVGFVLVALIASPWCGRLWLAPETTPPSYRVVIWMIGTTMSAFLALCGWSLFVGAGAGLGRARAWWAARAARMTAAEAQGQEPGPGPGQTVDGEAPPPASPDETDAAPPPLP